MKYTIYKITNKVNGKVYIGKHQTNNPYDSYFGSGKYIKYAIKKYGKENFEKEVLFIFDTIEEMNKKELELVSESFISNNNNYNAGVGGEGGPHFNGKKHTKSTKNRLSELAKGRVYSKETRDKISEGNRRRGTPSMETKKKLSDKAKGRSMSDEQRKKHSERMREWHLGRK